MRVDLELDPDRASALCRQAQGRLMNDVVSLSETVLRSSSRLPGWTIGHVLTHLARNADAHTRRLTHALRGVDAAKYEGGEEQRRADIETGAHRSRDEIVADLAASQARLEDVFTECAAAAWPNGHFRGGSHYGVLACPSHRLREVEMHHVDLGLGYTPADWPDDYVEWELPNLLASVPERLGSGADRRQLTAWLAGRGSLDPHLQLAPW